MSKVVFTRTIDEPDWENTVLAKGNIVHEINKLKVQDDQDIIAYGGGTFVSSRIKYGLVNEFHSFVNLVAIGNGMPIFSELDKKQNLTLIKATSFNCGIVILHYTLARNS
ncbi:dihydrofolate reductase family protein [Spirosoma radiotolerans]|uniref:dihydrofolate reductase family protein n=1 Tax=Spirosoma radiotolerans TaxID=1379870 RepID=UPI0021D16BBD|nr:dihydrofolate reductase family protein [Spirosoma radiotolerans]